MVSKGGDRPLRLPIKALEALQAFDSWPILLGGLSERGTRGAGMTGSSFPKQLPLEIDRLVVCCITFQFISSVNSTITNRNDIFK